MSDEDRCAAAPVHPWWKTEAYWPCRCTRVTVVGSPWWWGSMLSRRKFDYWGWKERRSDRRLMRDLIRRGLVNPDGTAKPPPLDLTPAQEEERSDGE